MGPAEFIFGQDVDVRPHPHIGLATVTYLFRGEFQHHDSLGSNQIILPRAVNWMVAGRGVTHSERTSAATRKAPHSLFGIQTCGRPARGSGGRSAELRASWQGVAPYRREQRRERSADPRPGATVKRRRSRSSPRRSTPLLISRPVLACHSPTITRIGASTSSKARFRSWWRRSVRPDDHFSTRSGSSRPVPPARASSSSAARRSEGPGTSGGTSSPLAGRGSKPPRSSGGKPTGVAAYSTCRPTTATNSRRCRRTCADVSRPLKAY